MLNEIEKKYNIYLGIYNDLSSIDDETVKRMLENSLYLSVFTLFEFFLKSTIQQYINISNNLSILDLHEDVAYIIFLAEEKRIKNIYQNNETKGGQQIFKSFYNSCLKEIDKETLSKYIKFEFLHKSKLENHYNLVFKQILSRDNFFKGITLKDNKENGILQETTTNAYTFLFDFTDKIRNNIAHENDRFRVSSCLGFDFETSIEYFKVIMREIDNEFYNKYKQNISEDGIRENSLDSI